MENTSSICFICANKPEYWATTECNHSVCSVCILRLRSLYGNLHCPMCKTPSPKVFISKSRHEFNAAAVKNEIPHEINLKIWFESKTCQNQVLSLLKIKCPICKVDFPTKAELKHHAQIDHNQHFCDVCLAHKKVFFNEYRLYSKSALLKHQKEGDGPGVKGHPTCLLCGGTLFYSEDEFQEHLRQKHEQCHICKRTNPHDFNWHRDYRKLEEHFGLCHYGCRERLCLEMKFVVFETEVELKTHMLEMHMGPEHRKLQRSAQNQLRRIDAGLFVDSRRLTRNNNNANNTSNINANNNSNNNANVSINFNGNSSNITVNVDATKFVFGEAIGDLAGKLQSLVLYDQRNGDFVKRLTMEHRLSKEKAHRLVELCQNYQKRSINVSGLFNGLGAALTVDELKKVFPELVELQLDPARKSDMIAEMKAFEYRTLAFPPLPINPKKTAVSEVKPVAKVLTVKKVVPGPKVTPSNFDPSRNPLKLLNKHVPPSFNQAVRVGPSTMVSEARPKESHKTVFSTDQFPSLSKTDPPTTAQPSTNVFAQESETTDSFTLGEANPPISPPTPHSSTEKPKKKKQILLKYG